VWLCKHSNVICQKTSVGIIWKQRVNEMFEMKRRMKLSVHHVWNDKKNGQ
jgi:hypothetical protein